MRMRSNITIKTNANANECIIIITLLYSCGTLKVAVEREKKGDDKKKPHESINECGIIVDIHSVSLSRLCSGGHFSFLSIGTVV